MKRVLQLFIAVVSGIFIGLSAANYIVLRNWNNSKKNSYRDRLSYRRYTRVGEQDRHGRQYWTYRFDIGDIFFTQKSKAESALLYLENTIRTYRHASVEDLCDILGKNGLYTSSLYGWKNLDGAKIERLSFGYRLLLPAPVELD